MQFTTVFLSAITATLAGLTTATPLYPRTSACAYVVAVEGDLLTTHAVAGLSQNTCNGVETCLTTAGATQTDGLLDVIEQIATQPLLDAFLTCATAAGAIVAP